MDPMIRRIVNRCHVGERYVDVLRYVLSRTTDQGKTFKAMPRAKRRQVIACVFEVHKENRELYCAVQTGDFK